MAFRSLALCLALGLAGTAQAIEFTQAELARATALQQRLLTLDSHLDTPANLARPDFDILADHGGNPLSQVDYPRMVKGAFDGGFWAIYTGQGERTEQAWVADQTAGLARLVEIREMLAAHPDRFGLALTPADARRVKAAGKRVVFISMENASPLVKDPSLLDFYDREGLRLMSLVHFTNNELADSATDPKGPEWHGISPAGKALLEQAVARGILIDQSHASDAVFDQLVALLPVPFIASHSGARAVHDHPRNLDDARLRALAAKGGVVQVNSYPGYVTDEGASPERKQAEETATRALGDWETMTLAQGRELARIQAELDAKYPLRHTADLDDFLAHLDHILKLVGPEHVGIGMDWDGGGGVAGMRDVADLPKITAWLLRKGYDEQQIADIWGGNLMRVMQQVQDYAAAHRPAAGH
ncbi:dipeptidase [Xanthomonas massiliensis]|uniref:dipeptidase n=1 Tax=Xanthomonas massiliensis TaxID=1720302 RepID=UPI00164E3EF5|nr:dipeptidase [Xanthomonas massiliensis]